ncbi:MAG TPA: peptide chain release factor N(5)-glutamine methyltransferase [Oleiagrimonas sp.]|nr:peptide chain release factor N(5)-glutamine methyltransferase [Oleiagrimonas sp.]
MASVGELLQMATRALPGDEARSEAELLLGHALGVSRAWLFAHANDCVAEAQHQAYTALIERRAQGEPVAYLTGRRGFWTLDLEVTPATLIPRPETETLVEQALARLSTDRACTVVDLGTGSGAIALAVASERPRAQVVATDASSEALAVARGNAVRLGLRNVEFLQGDWLAPLAGRRFDMIVSNPPYIEAGDAHLARGDLRFEPPAALASGADGLDAIRRIVRDARDHLEPGGWLLLEHGWNQGEAVRALLRESGYAGIFTATDLEDRDRVTAGNQPSPTTTPM